MTETVLVWAGAGLATVVALGAVVLALRGRAKAPAAAVDAGASEIAEAPVAAPLPEAASPGVAHATEPAWAPGPSCYVKDGIKVEIGHGGDPGGAVSAAP